MLHENKKEKCEKINAKDKKTTKITSEIQHKKQKPKKKRTINNKIKQTKEKEKERERN